MAKYWALRLLLSAAGRFPALSYRLAALAGWLAYHLNRRARRAVLRNLRPACSSIEETRREARRAFQNAARYYVDLACTPKHRPETFERDHLRLIHEENLPALFEPGPTIVLSAHIGNPELALIAIAARGRTFVELVEPLEPKPLAQYIAGLREAAGGTVVETDRAGARAVLKALRDGGLVAVMGDRDIQGTGVCVTMFGRRVRLPRGPWDLAQRTEARVVPMLLQRGSDARARVRVEPTITVPKEGEAAIVAAAQRWACLLEQHIRRSPGQWTVLEDFWEVHGCGQS